MEVWYLALVIILIILIVCWLRPLECFNIPKDPAAEYVPPNMSFAEFKTINEWDYPGYLNVLASKNNEYFGDAYPGGRYNVNSGPYIVDPKLDLVGIGKEMVYVNP